MVPTLVHCQTMERHRDIWRSDGSSTSKRSRDKGGGEERDGGSEEKRYGRQTVERRLARRERKRFSQRRRRAAATAARDAAWRNWEHLETPTSHVSHHNRALGLTVRQRLSARAYNNCMDENWLLTTFPAPSSPTSYPTPAVHVGKPPSPRSLTPCRPPPTPRASRDAGEDDAVFIIEDEDPWAAVPALLPPSTKCVVNGVDIATSMSSIFTKNTLSRWLDDNVLNAYGHA